MVCNTTLCPNIIIRDGVSGQSYDSCAQRNNEIDFNFEAKLDGLQITEQTIADIFMFTNF